MKVFLSLTCLTLASALVAPASAESNWYVGAAYNAQEFSVPGRDFNAAGLIAGYQFHEYFSVEARGLTGTSGYSSFYGTPDEPEGNYSEDIDTQVSVQLKASYPIFESLRIYGLAGFTQTKLEINGYGQYNDEDGNITGNYPYRMTYTDDGFSYGAGLSYGITTRFDVFVDYQVLPNFEPNSNISRSWNSTTIGVNYRF
ncbi:MAG: porin family protein [Idiomarina sp.]|nr:porin family protein [Idiomarina sp.]